MIGKLFEINKNNIKTLAIVGMATSALCVSNPVKADIFDTAISRLSSGFDYIWPDGVQFDDFSYRLGMGFGVTPDYNGSNDYHFRIIPLIDIRYKNRWTLQGSKFRVNIFDKKGLKIGPLVNYRFGRNEKDNDALAGMGNTSGTVQVGAFAELESNYILASAEYRYALGGGHGSEAIFLLGNGIYHDEKWLVVVGVRGVWSSKKHLDTNYGVNAQQSLATGYSVTNMGAGFSNIGLNFIARYQITKKIRVENIVGFSKIIGSASDSPLVRGVGTSGQLIIGTGLRYSF